MVIFGRTKNDITDNMIECLRPSRLVVSSTQQVRHAGKHVAKLCWQTRYFVVLIGRSQRSMSMQYVIRSECADVCWRLAMTDIIY